jgi:hypothetical protein
LWQFVDVEAAHENAEFGLARVVGRGRLGIGFKSCRIERNDDLEGTGINPMRSWEKKTGPGLSNLTTRAVSSMKGLSTTSPIPLNRMSTPR